MQQQPTAACETCGRHSATGVDEDGRIESSACVAYWTGFTQGERKQALTDLTTRGGERRGRRGRRQGAGRS